MLAVGLIMLTVFAAANTPTVDLDAAKTQLTETGIAPELAQKIIDIQVSVTGPEIEELNDDQKAVATEVQSEIVMGGVGTAVGATAFAGMGIAIAIACFVSGLIGWLLTMKKKVLQCHTCRAVVGTS